MVRTYSGTGLECRYASDQIGEAHIGVVLKTISNCTHFSPMKPDAAFKAEA